jgi:hypothetical protein
MRPAIGASRSFSLAHGIILPLTKTVVNFKIKLGHCQIKTRPLGGEAGQYLLPDTGPGQYPIFGSRWR